MPTEPISWFSGALPQSVMSPVSRTPSTWNWSTTWRIRSNPAGLRCRSDTCSRATVSSVAAGRRAARRSSSTACRRSRRGPRARRGRRRSGRRCRWASADQAVRVDQQAGVAGLRQGLGPPGRGAQPRRCRAAARPWSRRRRSTGSRRRRSTTSEVRAAPAIATPAVRQARRTTAVRRSSLTWFTTPASRTGSVASAWARSWSTRCSAMSRRSGPVVDVDVQSDPAAGRRRPRRRRSAGRRGWRRRGRWVRRSGRRAARRQGAGQGDRHAQRPATGHAGAARPRGRRRRGRVAAGDSGLARLAHPAT